MFGKNLQRLRREAEMKQEDVARKCGVDRATISKWESGEFSPRADKLVALARCLNCTVDDLFQEA